MPIVSNAATADVRAVLQRFQDGYSKRDRVNLEAFMSLFAPDATLEVIGTSAISTTSDEWCVGHDAVRALIEADWASWGDLVLEVTGAVIHTYGDVAWLATTGTVSQTIPLAQSATNIANYLQHVVGTQPHVDLEGELLTVILGAASTLANTRQGEHYIWPLRFTAVLVKQERWQFHQIHFSYPTIHDPDVRIP